ncbi:MAG: endonuclease Q family protein [Candidatus Daviesbacteria bacterium]|nr:endonuclease Q family protein [Candidatus Daviesbacteria bacterium]
MAYVADLHLHSRFSRACSPQLNIPNLSKWAKFKGIDLLGTADFLHPVWFAELKKDLREWGNGLYQHNGVKFLLSTEISCIYTEGGKCRRIHLVIFLPSFESVSKLSAELIKRKVNLASDGRPITGLSVKQICEIVFGVDKSAIIIPAHIWTPWFSLFGSESGFDFFKECFGEFSDSIYAVETGLSSEPEMNWRVADLDNKSIVSFSDAHSLPNIGREVTLFKGDLGYSNLLSDLKTQNIVGTIEFFPEEGKYHWSGHRNCNVIASPEDIRKNGETCPKCGKRLTIGVAERVEKLASRSVADLDLETIDGVIKSKKYPNRPGFRMLVGLEKIIAEALGQSVGTQKVRNEYDKLVMNLDPELKILTKTSLDLIKLYSGEKIAEGVDRVRQGKLSIKPGYDNTYGVINIWDGTETEEDIK